VSTRWPDCLTLTVSWSTLQESVPVGDRLVRVVADLDSDGIHSLHNHLMRLVVNRVTKLAGQRAVWMLPMGRTHRSIGSTMGWYLFPNSIVPNRRHRMPPHGFESGPHGRARESKPVRLRSDNAAGA
jgi:hypothetical protein